MQDIEGHQGWPAGQSVRVGITAMYLKGSRGFWHS
jgi:hypothetical protein